jgi:hypothetical protein
VHQTGTVQGPVHTQKLQILAFNATTILVVEGYKYTSTSPFNTHELNIQVHTLEQHFLSSKASQVPHLSKLSFKIVIVPYVRVRKEVCVMSLCS